MANEESAVFSNVLLVLLLVAVVVMGSFWLYRQMGPAAPAEDDGPSINVDLGGNGNGGSAPQY
jgi:hypothetical protein